MVNLVTNVVILLVTPVISFPLAIAPGSSGSTLLYTSRRIARLPLLGLRGGFVSDIQQQIFADARRDAKVNRPTELTSLKKSASSEIESAPPAPGI